MTYKYIDVNPNLKRDIEMFVRDTMEQIARDVARTAVENVCKEYIEERLTAKVGVEVEKFEIDRLEDAVAAKLKQYGIVPRMNETVNFESVKLFLELYPKFFDNMSKQTSTDDVYNFYCDMCEEEDIEPVHKKTFSRELNRLAGIKTKVKSVRGNAFRVYTR